MGNSQRSHLFEDASYVGVCVRTHFHVPVFGFGDYMVKEKRTQKHFHVISFGRRELMSTLALFDGTRIENLFLHNSVRLPDVCFQGRYTVGNCHYPLCLSRWYLRSTFNIVIKLKYFSLPFLLFRELVCF